MATSGTYNFSNIDVAELLTDAYQRIGFPEEKLNAMHMISGRRSLNFLLTEWSSKNLNLWTVQQQIVSPVENQNTYTLPSGTVDVIEVFLRVFNRPSGTATSTAGGTASYAFDGLLTTACTQTSSNGRIYLDYGADGSETITMIGVRVAADVTISLIFEYSEDASTWTTAYDAGSATYDSSETTWYMISVPVGARYFSSRAYSGGTQNMTELYFVTQLQDTKLGRISRSNYAAVSQKYQQGRPSAFMVNRLISPTMNIYPAPDDAENTVLVYNRIRHMYDVSAATQTFDVPQRFLEAIASGVAAKLATKFAPERKAELMSDAAAAFAVAAAEDRDRAPFQVMPDMSGGPW